MAKQPLKTNQIRYKQQIQRLQDKTNSEIQVSDTGKLEYYSYDEGEWIQLSQKETEFIARRSGLKVGTPKKPKPVVKAPREKTKMELLLEGVPKPLRPVMNEIYSDPQLSWAVNELMGRFDNPMTAMLAGAGIEEQARMKMDDAMDEAWKRLIPREVPELVIGAGLHAAIYCAVRVMKGFPAPWVVEAGERAGGSFAVSKRPSFFLNSRNRPGPLSIPGDLTGSLNFLPGAPIQPSDLGGGEYQTNDQLAYVVRATLAMYGNVVTNAMVTGASLYYDRRGYRNGKYKVNFADGRSTLAGRLIFSTGLGSPSRRVVDGRVLTFNEFMAKMDEPFPLRGMNRVAVLGAGDGGKTAIEALTGQGPGNRLSVASLDWPEKIDWFGPAPASTCQTWRDTNRNRYSQIAKLLPSAPNNADGRVRPRGISNDFYVGFGGVSVNQMMYDYVIDCTGYNQVAPQNLFPYAFNYFAVGGRTVGYCANGYEAYAVGPAAPIEANAEELNVLKAIGENVTSVFRFADRTAALAASFQT